MKRALALAKKGWGATSPNPLVGAVIVRNGMKVGEGYHSAYGQPHAEVMALHDAGNQAQDAEMYVTLEPCCHHGKTPPCTEAIIRAGVKKVFAAIADPNPKVASQGFTALKEAGVKVQQGLLHEEATKMNEIFIHFITHGTPLIIHKTAMSLDGKTATNSGHSQWITGEEARNHVHWMRQRVAAIMVGVDTVIHDNPSLTVRGINAFPLHPLRIIADSTGRIPLTSQVLTDTSGAKTLVATTDAIDPKKAEAIVGMGAEVIRLTSDRGRISMPELMLFLGNRHIDSLLLEGGGELAASVYEAGLADQVMYYIAPKLIGGLQAAGVIKGKGIEHMAEAILLKNMRYEKIGEDLLVTGQIVKG